MKGDFGYRIGNTNDRAEAVGIDLFRRILTKPQINQIIAYVMNRSSSTAKVRISNVPGAYVLFDPEVTN